MVCWHDGPEEGQAEGRLVQVVHHLVHLGHHLQEQKCIQNTMLMVLQYHVFSMKHNNAPAGIKTTITYEALQASAPTLVSQR